MDDKSTLPAEALQALSIAFEWKDQLPKPSITMADVKAYLTQNITKLLARNPDKLMSILYRIDVLEHHVMDAFKNTPTDKLADHLADLVIDRQLQKLYYRKKYKS